MPAGIMDEGRTIQGGGDFDCLVAKVREYFVRNEGEVGCDHDIQLFAGSRCALFCLR
jgi:hypothetical protein